MMMPRQNHGKHTNRLSQEKFPYLLQHAHNPVDWHTWGTDAFLYSFPLVTVQSRIYGNTI